MKWTLERINEELARTSAGKFMTKLLTNLFLITLAILQTIVIHYLLNLLV